MAIENAEEKVLIGRDIEFVLNELMLPNVTNSVDDIENEDSIGKSIENENSVREKLLRGVKNL